jgi:precorrin-2 dehydrogenase/sirohydrochlorin ferrochelatase
LEAYFGDEYGPFLRLMGAVRDQLLERGHAPEDHRRIFGLLIDGGLQASVKAGDRTGIRNLLTSVLGNDVDVERLMALE